MNNFELCRKNLETRLGIDTYDNRTADQVSAEIKGITDSLTQIYNLAKPRLIMGGIRYGSNWKHKSLMNYMQKKFDIYKETGNIEMLIDLVNFCAIEMKLKTHPNYNFTPKDNH